MAPDKEPSKVDFIQVVQFGMQAGQLTNVIADHVEQTFGHVFFGKVWKCRKSKANYTHTEETPVDCAFLTEPGVGEIKIQDWSSFPYVWRRKVLPARKTSHIKCTSNKEECDLRDQENTTKPH